MKYYLSLGAGVQSSALALMLENKYIDFPKPEFAIFADTQAEPKEVYEWLEWLKTKLTYPVYTCSKGDLFEDSLKLHTSALGRIYTKASPPAWIVENGNNKKGLLMRQCTTGYKIQTIKKEVRKHIKLSKNSIVGQYIGISIDEASRMKASRDRRIENIYPLVELGLNRSDCKKYIENNYGLTPPRSACIFCPFHNDNEWKKLFEVEEYKTKIIEYENRLQKSYSQVHNFRGVPYLHRSYTSISQEPFKSNNLNMFENDCEGYCGV